MRRYDFFEGRLNRKGLFKPHTIGERETGRSGRSSIFAEERVARLTGRSGFSEDDGKHMKDEGIEMIS
jgi:hypothetical protein